jgi:hypothetical protein
MMPTASHHNVLPVTGWMLVCKDEDAKNWHIAWLDIFGTKKSALAFAAENKWPQPYRAIRGALAAQ